VIVAKISDDLWLGVKC